MRDDLGIEPEWKVQQRLWGHPFHPMCSYLASFPAALAHAFVARYTRPGDVVLDPFCGRGTTPLQGCVEGRIGVGNDLNPLAHVLTAAKMEPPTSRALDARLSSLRIDWSLEAPAWLELAGRVVTGKPHAALALVPAAGSGLGPRGGSEPVPAEVTLAFHPGTLAQVLFARARLRLDDPADRFLAAGLAGILHGKRPGYLSELMPNAFSMAPRYARDYAARTSFVAPDRDLFVLLAAKLRRLARDGRPGTTGIALLGDARDAGLRARAALRDRALPDRARLVLTSPPYLRVLKYGYYNWLRAWYLGFSAAEIDATLDDAHRRENDDLRRDSRHAGAVFEQLWKSASPIPPGTSASSAIAAGWTLGQGRVFVFGNDLLFRAQPHGNFKFFFNAMYLSVAPTMKAGAGGN